LCRRRTTKKRGSEERCGPRHLRRFISFCHCRVESKKGKMQRTT
jgi:hypothetical protein